MLPEPPADAVNADVPGYSLSGQPPPGATILIQTLFLSADASVPARMLLTRT